MPDNSPILDLPLLQPAQAQKHVTHNEALTRLDVLVQLVAESLDATTPPALPAEGEVHVTGTGATGAWAGHDHAVACHVNGAWLFQPLRPGWRAWDKASASLRLWDGSAWVLPEAASQNTDGLGIRTSWDSTNRLAVSAPATLLSHDGAGHQLKVNKAAVGDTASLLFQSNWSGRAEMGLTGDDDFSVKVSPDGSSWKVALSVDAASGNVGIGTQVPAYPLTVTASGAGRPIAMRMQNFQGEASTIAATRGLVLSADHDDNSALAQSYIGFEVDAIEVMRIPADGKVTVGTGADTAALHLRDVLRLEPRAAAPAAPATGDIYFDSTLGRLRCWDGSAWQNLF